MIIKSGTNFNETQSTNSSNIFEFILKTMLEADDQSIVSYAQSYRYFKSTLDYPSALTQLQMELSYDHFKDSGLGPDEINMLYVIICKLSHLAGSESHVAQNDKWLKNGSIPNQDLYTHFHFINLFCRKRDVASLACCLEYCQLYL